MGTVEPDQEEVSRIGLQLLFLEDINFSYPAYLIKENSYFPLFYRVLLKTMTDDYFFRFGRLHPWLRTRPPEKLSQGGWRGR